MSAKVTIGADPEFPIATMDKKHQLVTGWAVACGKFGGDKGAPVSCGPEGGWLEDGTMLELNPTPAEDPNVLAASILTLLQKANEHVKKEGLAVSIADTVYFSEEELAKYPQASVFGCSADYSAYSPGIPRTNIMDAAMCELGNSVRFAGGHVHLGLSTWPEELPKFVAVKFLDLFLLLPHMRSGWHQYTDRAHYYGSPGLYRETSYGIEYRTPNNTWVSGGPGSYSINKWFLNRLYDVGLVFANFERFKDRLVEVYNTIPWEEFYAHMSVGNSRAATTLLIERGGIEANTGHLYLGQDENGDVKINCVAYDRWYSFHSKSYAYLTNNQKEEKLRKIYYYATTTGTIGQAAYAEREVVDVPAIDADLIDRLRNARAVMDAQEVPEPPELDPEDIG